MAKKLTQTQKGGGLRRRNGHIIIRRASKLMEIGFPGLVNELGRNGQVHGSMRIGSMDGGTMTIKLTQIQNGGLLRRARKLLEI